ncbi:hypothetical protein TTHERM_002653350, partial (macronuclear) [Tetrahymena thermophila SB210]
GQQDWCRRSKTYWNELRKVSKYHFFESQSCEKSNWCRRSKTYCNELRKVSKYHFFESQSM